MEALAITHVAVGVIINEHEQVLISRRHPDSHKGGLWEFPGGKKEESETIEAALQREFVEELGIKPTKFHPFTKTRYHYPEKTVLLDVWIITEYEGEAIGKEGQAIEWRELHHLRSTDFPEANAPIIKRIQLPKEFAITADLESSEELPTLFKKYSEQGIQLIQFRQTHLDQANYVYWLQSAVSIARDYDIHIVANQSPDTFGAAHASGLHVNSNTLMSLVRRPVASDLLFSASCHSFEELHQAQILDADFVTLSPVCYTSKYGSGNELGWDSFSDLAGRISLPVYALGGLGRDDLQVAQSCGAFGIAGISAYL
ncbi:MAG: Nudix family hydrolase [Pseudomonadales bacterium]|nr:Nudix family hydrolase [Pseudomonadales bacterium]